MGDRRMAEIKTSDGSIYFYTHWCGTRLPEIAREAVTHAKPRLDDESYWTRIVLDRLISGCGARDQETGAGIMLSPSAEDSYDPAEKNQPTVIIDASSGEITVRGGNVPNDDQGGD